MSLKKCYELETSQQEAVIIALSKYVKNVDYEKITEIFNLGFLKTCACAEIVRFLKYGPVLDYI